MDYDEIWTFILSFAIFTSLTTMLAACLCCRKKVPKNDLLGLEGMVKIKNPDDNLHNSTTALRTDTVDSVGDNDVKRSSNAPHRSLPDIPASDQAAVDTNSDLYATVGDKVQGRPQGRSPSSLKKQSVSQHSSLSQADDVSSPYASVRSPSHAYDKIRKTEHPYAQLQPNQANPPNDHNGLSRRASNESLLGTNEPTGADIPAASAIAGRISASQELPYMTPPITQPQHFSGDSQDSSKGYTSISVREPLANILAQTKKQNAQTRRRDLSDSHYATVSDDSDEMYAAIDDPNNPVDLYTSGSETYAQIQPPNAMVVSVEINTPSTVRNEPDQAPEATSQQNIDIPGPSLVDNFRAQATVHSRQASSSSVTSAIGILGSPKPEKRQANSPLPPTPKNKNVAHYSSSNSNLTSTSSTQSGRNSVASVVDTHQLDAKADTLHPGDDETSVSKCKKSPSKDLEGMYAKVMKKNKLSNLPSQNSSPQMGRKFPQGDRASTAEPEVFISDSDISNGTPVPDSGRASVHESPGKYSVRSAGQVDNNYETIERKLSRGRSSSYGEKDPGYETIPGEKRDVVDAQSRSSAPPGLIAPNEVLQKVDYAGRENTRSAFLYNQSMEDPGYEIVKQRGISTSDYDPNYEVLRPTNSRDEDGYSRIWDKGEKRVNRFSGGDLLDGYSSIKVPHGGKSGNETETDSDVPGYSSIQEVKKMSKVVDVEPGYSIICDKTENEDALVKKLNASINNNNILDDSDIYSSIPHSENPSYLSIQDNVHNYSTIGETPSSSQTLVSSPGYSSISDTLTATTTPSSESMSSDQLLYRSHMHTTSSNYESLTGSESDPNYETVRYLGVKENPYERLHNEKASSPECQGENSRPSDAGGGGGNHISGNGPIPVIPASNVEGQEVSDYFQV